MKTEMIQLKGKAHKEYIFNLAMELWEKAGWVNTDLDDHIKEALKVHREMVYKAMIAEEAEKSKPKPPRLPKGMVRICVHCKNEIHGKTFLAGLCDECWKHRYCMNLS